MFLIIFFTIDINRLTFIYNWFNKIGKEDNGELPDGLNTDRARKYFKRAVEAGFMEKTDTGYKWIFSKGLKVALGYFVEKIYCPKGKERLPETELNKLFGVSRIGSAISQRMNAKKKLNRG